MSCKRARFKLSENTSLTFAYDGDKFQLRFKIRFSIWHRKCAKNGNIAVLDAISATISSKNNKRIFK